MNLILLGAPGAGKGTQGNFLVRDFGLKKISTGDIFREILKDESHPLYNDVKVIKEGKLVTDETVNSVVRYAVETSENKNFIFDGYPRTLAQADALDKIMSDNGMKIEYVVELSVTKEVLMYRLLGRRTCRSCKSIFHVSNGHETCPECGGELYTRDDDNEETVQARFEEYNTKTLPLIEHYKNKDVKYIKYVVDNKDLQPAEIHQKLIVELK